MTAFFLNYFQVIPDDMQIKIHTTITCYMCDYPINFMRNGWLVGFCLLG